MAKTLRSYRSTLRMAFFSTLLLAALTVLGMAVLPQQFAHAAATAEGATVRQGLTKPSKPKVTVVNCVEDVRAAYYTICEDFILVGDRVSVTSWKPYKGEDETLIWKKCEWVFEAVSVTTTSPDIAQGIILVAVGDACRDLQIFKGSRGAVVDYVVKKAKKCPKCGRPTKK